MKTEEDADLFARSAFNRYYYGVYLLAREVQREIAPDAKTNHAGILTFLSGLRSKMGKLALTQKKKHALSEAEYRKLKAETNMFAGNFADMLRRAYRVRRIADFDSLSPARITRGDIELDGVTGHSALNWFQLAEGYKKALLRIWKNLGR